MGIGPTVIVVLTTCFVGTAVVFVFASREARRMHTAFRPSDVESALQCVLDDSQCCHDEFDLFLTWPIDDPYLEAIRERCHRILRTCAKPGEDISEDGKEQIRAILRELQSAPVAQRLRSCRACHSLEDRNEQLV